MKIIINTFDDHNHLINSKILKVENRKDINESTKDNILDFIEESSYSICEHCDGSGTEELYEDYGQIYRGTRTCICQLQDNFVNN